MELRDINTRKAVLSDLDALKAIADANKTELGFMTRQTFVEAIQLEQVMVITVDEKVVGFQHYNHRKKDGQTTLYHKAILYEYRGQGLGKILVNTVAEEARQKGKILLLLKCPVDLPSNKFHESIGFKLIGQEQGKKRKLNIWEFRL